MHLDTQIVAICPATASIVKINSPLARFYYIHILYSNMKTIQKLGLLILSALLLQGSAAVAQTPSSHPVVKITKGKSAPTTGTEVQTNGPARAGKQAKQSPLKKAQEKAKQTIALDTVAAQDSLAPTPQQMQIRALADRIIKMDNEYMKHPESVRYIQVDYIWADLDQNSACAYWHSAPIATQFDKNEILLSQHLNATALVIPDSITCRGKTIPVVSIAYEGFSDCDLLQYVALPNTIRDIYEYAFGGCTNLKGIALPEQLEMLPIGFAWGCTQLQELPLPHTLREMPWLALASCTKIDNIVLPDSLLFIGPEAFWGCSNLSRINIPASVEKIAVGAFAHCDNLRAINVAIGNQHYISHNGVLMSRDFSTLYQYPAGKRTKGYAIPGDVTEICWGAFSGNKHLQMIGMPANLINIPEGTFANCSDLTGIDIPEGVGTIGATAFARCASLRKITLPSTLKVIDGEAFDSCALLTAVNIPDSLTAIEWRAFHNCHNITSIVLPQNLSYLGVGAFRNCTSLRSVALPDSLTSLLHGTFYGCSSINTIALPQNLKEIRDSAFFGCRYASILLLNAGLTTIGSGAFANCSNVESLHLPASLTNIGDGSFFGCSKLNELHLEQLVPISHAFDNVDKITLYVPKHLKKEAQKRAEYKAFKKIKGE